MTCTGTAFPLFPFVIPGLFFLLSFRAWPGIQAAKESILTWIPARRPVWQEERKCCGMTGREKNAACDRKELIRRSLDDCSAIEGWLFWGDVFLRKRGMTLLGETIMGGTEYYQKISLLFSWFVLNSFSQFRDGLWCLTNIIIQQIHLVVEQLYK